MCLLFLELAASVQIVAAAGLSAQERVGAGRHLRQGAPLRPQVDQWGVRFVVCHVTVVAIGHWLFFC